MPRRGRKCKVILTEHALQRWKERGGQGKLKASEVRRRLLAILPVGMEVHDEAIEVPMGNGLYVRCVADFSGCWVGVTTVTELERRQREREQCLA